MGSKLTIFKVFFVFINLQEWISGFSHVSWRFEKWIDFKLYIYIWFKEEKMFYDIYGLSEEKLQSKY